MSRVGRYASIAATIVAAAALPVAAWEPVAIPAAVEARLPPGHVARLGACSRTLDPPAMFCIVVAARDDEGRGAQSRGRRAPARPLLVYRLAAGGAKLIDRNDAIVLRRDEGGQCDPVEDGGAITIKGRLFTLESGVACGQHWTDYTTFRFDARIRAFVWRSSIYESWEMNDTEDAGQDALVSRGKKVMRADPRHPVRLRAYKPR